VVDALVALDRGQDAFTEAQSGTEDRLEESRNRLLAAWSQTGRTYSSVAGYWASVGVPERAVEVVQSLVDALEKEVQSSFDIPTESNLADAYVQLSWRQLFAKRFADAQATAEKGLQLPVSEVRKAILSTNLAHALLLQGDTEKALAVYEAWKTKPVESKAEYPKLFAQSILDDFAELEQEGLLKGIDAVPSIRAEMQAAVDAAPKPPPKAAK
jgi:tetratricopeptide (TPR) repeat protein